MLMAALAVVLSAALALLPGCAGDAGAGPSGDLPEIKALSIRVSMAGSVVPGEDSSQHTRLLDHLSKKTGYTFVLVPAGSNAGVQDRLAREEIDMAFLWSGGYTEAYRELGARPLAAPVIAGQPFYHSYIIVSSGAGISTFEDLRGRRFAFSDPASLTGALYPASRINESGADPEQFFSALDFTYDDEESIRSLRAGLIDGAAVSSIFFEYMVRNDPSGVEGINVIEQSPPFGSPPVVTRLRLPPELRDRLREVLAGMKKDPEGKEILDGLGIDHFTPVDESHYESVRPLESSLAS